MAKKAYDWGAIKIQFIHSSLSIKDFSEKYGTPYGTLRKQVAQGKWLEERNNIGSDTEQKSIEFSVANRAARLAKIDEEYIKLADEITRKARELMASVDSPMALKALASSIKESQSIARLAMGASTENQSKQEVDAFADWVKERESGERQS